MSTHFFNQIVLNKKVLIEISDYNSFHKQHRHSDFQDSAHYIALYFMYHFIPFWQQHRKSQLEKLTDKKIKILGLWEGSYGLGQEWCEQVDVDEAVSRMKRSDLNLEDYDLVFNLFDSEINPRFSLGLNDKIESGELKLHPDAIYICFKSGNCKQKSYPLFNMELKHSFSNSPNNPNPVMFCDRLKNNPHHVFEIPYGPWPLNYLDWTTFTPWKKEEA